MPFGLRGKPGEANFDLFQEALVEALGLGQGQGQGQMTVHQAPKRLWLVAGSGFLLDVLHSIWPTTEYMVVQVGKRIWPDQLENKTHQLFIAPVSDTYYHYCIILTLSLNILIRTLSHIIFP